MDSFCAASSQLGRILLLDFISPAPHPRPITKKELYTFGMPTLDDVYRKFGEVAEAVALLETDLGTMLMFFGIVEVGGNADR
jgi:hypothetical protein